MNPKVQKALAVYRSQVALLLSEMSEISPENFREKPADHQWSLAQICAHLIEVEQLSLAYCQKKIQAGDSIPNVSWLTGVKMFVYLGALRSNLRFKAPRFISNPDNSRDAGQTAEVWNQSAKALEDFLERYPERYMQKAIYKNPVIGRISMLQTLQFLEAHLSHHLRQVAKTKQLVVGS